MSNDSKSLSFSLPLSIRKEESVSILNLEFTEVTDIELLQIYNLVEVFIDQINETVICLTCIENNLGDDLSITMVEEGSNITLVLITQERINKQPFTFNFLIKT